MATYADELLTNGFKVPLRTQLPELAEDWVRCATDRLSQAKIVQATNVAEYVWSRSNTTWDIREDFPCLAPPYPNFFVEYHRPGKIFSSVVGAPPERIGVLFEGVEYDEGEEITTQAELDEWAKLYPGFPPSTPKDLRWDVHAEVFLKNGGASFWAGDIDFVLNTTGGLVLPPRQRSSAQVLSDLVDDMLEDAGMPPAEWSAPEDVVDFQKLLFVSTLPALLAVSFMHCKNIVIETHEPPTALSKAHKKRRGRPLLRYHTLQIQPMQEVLRKEGRADELGLPQALHLCRGHFKDYRERGLFGKNKGLFWWNSHARGSVDEGVVEKDYKILSP